MTTATFNIDDLRTGIGTLEPTPSALSKRAVIKLMVTEIDAAIARGITLDQIKSYLDGKGLDLQLNTLRQYVADARRNAGTPDVTPPARRARKPAARPAKPTATHADTPSAMPMKATPGTDASKFVNVKDKDL